MPHGLTMLRYLSLPQPKVLPASGKGAGFRGMYILELHRYPTMLL
jgi:hypothetical protein